MRLRIDAHGQMLGEGTHLSAYIYLMKGENDDDLQWPFNGKISVQLLNWCSDSNHIEKMAIPRDWFVEYRERAIDKNRASGAFGLFHKFVNHCKLQETGYKSARYIENGNVCFRIFISD